MNTNKIKVIALFGESASGKDTIQGYISDNYNIHKIISCTTRPKREYEMEGIDYYFKTEKEFSEAILNGEMLEATSFREWFYGTPFSSLEETSINIGIFNIAGIEALLADSRLDIYPVYVQANEKTRLIRSLSREEKPDCEEICRRFLTDKKDFSDISFEYNIINNNYDYILTNNIELIMLPLGVEKK